MYMFAMKPMKNEWKIKSQKWKIKSLKVHLFENQ